MKGAILREEIEGRPLDTDTFVGGKAAMTGYGDSFIGNEVDGLVVHEGRLPHRAVPQSPNPGYPLPGHVMTNAYTAPGTEVWERFMLDGHDW